MPKESKTKGDSKQKNKSKTPDKSKSDTNKPDKSKNNSKKSEEKVKKTESTEKPAAVRTSDVKPDRINTKPPVTATWSGKKTGSAAVQGVAGSKIPNPKDVKEVNKRLAVAMKPSLPSTSKFGDAASAYSTDKEVVTTTHRTSQKLPPLIKNLRRK